MYRLYLYGDKDSCQIPLRSASKRALLEEAAPLISFLNLPVEELKAKNLIDEYVQKMDISKILKKRIILIVSVIMFIGLVFSYLRFFRAF
jgi:hypothetical protein